MAQHSFLQNLLQGQAVEWKTLGEVLVRTKGTKITAGKMKELHKSNAPIKIFAGGKTFALVDFDDIPQKDINHKPSIIVKSRGIIEFEYYDKPFSHKNEMWAYHSQNPNINIKFIYYFLKKNEPYFQKIGSKMQMPQIATPDTDKFKIPIPPLSVQSQIVQILDAFTELTEQLRDELTAELAMRQKQYHYYRDLLLTFDEKISGGENNPFFCQNVVWKSLGEIAKYSNDRILFSELDENNHVGVDNLLQNRMGKIPSNHVPQKGTLIKYVENDILIGNIRPYLKKIWQADQMGGTNGDVLVIRPTDKQVLPRFLYQVLADDKFFAYNMQHAKGAKMPRGNKQSILKYPIPIPPLSVQSQIVAILDTFDTLVNSICEGLPKEIQLRQKQYEYYRERLLGF